MRWRGNARQRSVSIQSCPAFWWQWSWSVGRSSYQDKSWWMMCSSRSVTWFLGCQTQSPLQEGCIHFYRSSRPNYNEMCLKCPNKLINKQVNKRNFSMIIYFWNQDYAVRKDWYLVAVNLHDRRPSPISTSKTSKVKKNRYKFCVNTEGNQLARSGPVKIINNCKVKWEAVH